MARAWNALIKRLVVTSAETVIASSVCSRRCSMSTERLVQELDKYTARRKFLKQLGAASLIALLGLIGLPETASAVNWHCCTLCFTPGSAQSWPACNGTNNYNEKTKWCWNCTDGSGVAYQCCEYMNVGAPCANPPCQYVFASYGRQIGSMPQP